ncbi:MAG TPA: cob(I)yrinic acid a,c-diamide adenosyltransferase [Microlunatus sp.]
MVNLTRIYTRTGDHGQTRLVDMSVTEKTDPRVAAYGDVDEANAAIGVALATGALPEPVRDVLAQVQNELFDLGADLGNPLASSYDFEPLRINQDYIDRLERWCDEFTADLPKLRSFILPGGNPAGAQLHVARTVTRRAERTGWQAIQQYGTEPSSEDQHRPGGINPLAIGYLNRLSDLLFILTRVVNGTEHEVLWVPGGDRSPVAADDHQPTDEDDRP